MAVRTIDEVFRDFNTNGVPSSGVHEPIKVDIRDTLNAELAPIDAIPNIEARLGAVEQGQNGGLIAYVNKAAMDADLTQPLGTVAILADTGQQYRFTGGGWVPIVSYINDAQDYGDARTNVDDVEYGALAVVSGFTGPALLTADVTGFGGLGMLYNEPATINFNAVRIPAIACGVATALSDRPSTFNIEVRDGSSVGTILATGVLNVDPNDNWFGNLVIPLSVTVTHGLITGPQFFVGFYGLTKSGSRAITGRATVLTGSVDYFASQSYYYNPATGAWVDYSGDPAMAFELVFLTGMSRTTVRNIMARQRIIDKENDLIVLPSVIPAVVGRPCDIVYGSAAGVRPSALDWSASATGNIGIPYAERYTLTPAGAGDVTFTLRAQDPFTGWSVCTKAATIRQVLANAGSASSINVLFTGDSLTAQSSLITAGLTAGYIERIGDLAVADANGPTITFLGTQGSAPDFHEGYGGQTVAWLYSNVASPFVFSGVFNFGAYMAAHSYASCDYFFIDFGINDAIQLLTDENTEGQAAISAKRIEAMIDSVRAFSATTKVVVCGPNPPSSSQDAFGFAYGGNEVVANQAQKRRLFNIWTNVMKDFFDGREAGGIYFHMPGLAYDPVNNVKRAANPSPANSGIQLAAPYATLAACLADLVPASGTFAYVTELDTYMRKVGPTTKGFWREVTEDDGFIRRQIDAVHPGDSGYAQRAERTYAFIKMLEA